MQRTHDYAVDIAFSVGDAPELIVRGHSGDISIEPGANSTIRVHADEFDSHIPFDGEPLGTSQEGDRVTIDTHRHGAGLHADLRIEVPVGCTVSVNTINGDVGVRGTRARVELTTVGGDIHLDQVEGASKITTVGGDIRADHMVGSLTLQTTNGDVSIRRSSLQRFNVHSVNGDLAFETPLERGQHYFAKSTNGDIELLVPPDTGATVQMRTTNGEIHCDLPTDVINRSKRNWQGRINDGGAIVELETLNGDTRISVSSDIAGSAAGVGAQDAPKPEMPQMPSMPEMPEMPGMVDIPVIPDMPELPDMIDTRNVAGQAPAGTGIPRTHPESAGDAAQTESRPDYSSPDSLAILAQLERGEITVEDAMAQLDALR